MRKTKIVATIGPASNQPEQIKALLAAGTNIIRINLSHAQQNLAKLVKTIHETAKTLNQPVGVIADLQGPKIRIGRFQNDAVNIKAGQQFTLSCDLKKPPLGSEQGVYVDYPGLCDDLRPGDHLLLDDGLIELRVEFVSNNTVSCKVIEGGRLKSHKGINRRGGGLNAGAITKKDEADLISAVDANVDYIALSFVKNAEDILKARTLLEKINSSQTRIIAKIERVDALNHLKEIIEAADSVMVARGDLAVEVGPAEVPGIQKEIIHQAQKLNKTVITATQMMESMIEHPTPTRAEVSDVANAILDGTDAVMLSAETASGRYPIKVIEMVDKVCRSAEKHAFTHQQMPDEPNPVTRKDLAIARACHLIASSYPIDAIVTVTESGSTAIWASRQLTHVPIFAVSDNEETTRLMCLVKNVYPIYFDYRQIPSNDLSQAVLKHLIAHELIQPHATVLLTRGQAIGQPGGTNRLEIVEAHQN